MAELTPTKVGYKVPVGPYWDQTFRVSAGADSAAEWFATGFNEVIAIVGYAIIGNTATISTAQFKKNVGTGTTGTSGTEGDNKGSVALNVSAAETVEVTVRGR